MQLVQLRLALFTIVLVRILALIIDTHTPAMLPHRTPIALDEQRTAVLRLRVRGVEVFAQWQSRKVLLTTDASRHLLFVGSRVVCLDIVWCRCFVFGGLGALAAAWRLAHLFAGARARCGRLWRVLGEFGIAFLTRR